MNVHTKKWNKIVRIYVDVELKVKQFIDVIKWQSKIVLDINVL